MRSLSRLALAWLLALTLSRSQVQEKPVPDSDHIIVETALGSITGKREGAVNTFLGIPFAEPPTGTFRFRPPRPKRAWAPASYQAFSFSPECLQSSLFTNTDDGIQKDEDCLYLNIWAPAKPKDKGLLPVLLWIYGGAFIHGGASKPEYVGDQLAARGVILVSCNYRMGALGFLVSTSDGLYGNYGLADQKLAMMWVQEHIRDFGGDPERVTLFGESAGAMSIGLHFLDQQYQQQRLARQFPGKPRQWLFHAIILQSNPLGYKYRSVAVSNFLGASYKDRLDCEDLRCLQSESADELIHVQDTLMAVIGDFFTWGPVVTDQHYWREYRLRPGPESNITVRQPIEALRDLVALGKRLDVPVIIGTTKDEGRVFVFTAFRASMPKLIYQAVVVSFFRGAAMRVLKQYSREAEREAESPYPDYRPVLSTIIGDYLFRCPNQLVAAQLTAAKTSVFLYEFALPTRTPGYPCCDGLACHTAELPYVFNQIKVIDDEYSWQAPPPESGMDLPVEFSGEGDMRGKFSFPDIFGAATSWFGSPSSAAGSADASFSAKPRIDTDCNVSNTMADYWTTFATFGDPNGLHSPPNGYDGTTRPKGAPWWPTLLGDLSPVLRAADAQYAEMTFPPAAYEFDEYSAPEAELGGGPRAFSASASSAAAARLAAVAKAREEDSDLDDDDEEREDYVETGGGDVRVRRLVPRYQGSKGVAKAPKKPLLVKRRTRDATMHLVKFDDVTDILLLENDCTCKMWETLGYQF